MPPHFFWCVRPKAARLATLEEEMQRANQDYAAAVARASAYPLPKRSGWPFTFFSTD